MLNFFEYQAVALYLADAVQAKLGCDALSANSSPLRTTVFDLGVALGVPRIDRHGLADVEVHIAVLCIIAWCLFQVPQHGSCTTPTAAAVTICHATDTPT